MAAFAKSWRRSEGIRFWGEADMARPPLA